jgi:hypothetical protein
MDPCIALVSNNKGMKNNYDFKLEFQQLKAYYNFRYHFKRKLKEGNSNKYDNEQYYLIDKKWLKNWKMHVGFNNICQERYNIHSYNKEINDNDYNNILPLLKIFYNQNTIYPLINKNIYYNGEINPISEFVIVDKNSFISFVSPNLLNENNKSFPIMFFKGNLLLKFSPTRFLLCFKVIIKEKEDFWELILYLLENVDENDVINHFTCLDDILDWLKKYDFDLNTTEIKEVSFYEHKINLVNKTLLINRIKDLLNENNVLMQEMNINNKISEEDIHEMEKKQTQIINKKKSFVDKKVPNIDFTAKIVDECINNNNSGKNIMNNMNIINSMNNMNIINSMNYMNNLNIINMENMNNMNNKNYINDMNYTNMNRMNNINNLNKINRMKFMKNMNYMNFNNMNN